MPSPKKPTITLLTGPTGSGKSALALRYAAARPAVIINADAMQMVDALRILTARPTEDEQQQAGHALYGVLPPASPTSVATWLAMVGPVIRRAFAEGKEPLLVGGTGMYLKALMEGLATIPPIPPEIREKYRALAQEQFQARATRHSPPATLHTLLAQKDPIMAARLKPGDTQRIARALEVIDATGISLATWLSTGTKPLFPSNEFRVFHIDIPKPELYARIDRRFETMMQNGALDETRALLALNLPPDTPILRAHGVPELACHLRGEMRLEAAIAKAQQNTRNYAKRQLTWVRNQLPGSTLIHSRDPAPLFMQS